MRKRESMNKAAVSTVPSEQVEPLVYVVLVNWNGWRRTLECIASLSQHDYGNSRVVVVDNGSADDSVERIFSGHPHIELIETGTNLGYAGGNNVGIRKALADRASYVWILNNDTLVASNALRELIACAEQKPTSAAVASRLLTVDGSEGAPSAYRQEARHPVPFRCPGCEQGFHEADFVDGASLLLRSSALSRVGLFDEDYFHYFTAFDLAERLRRGGWTVGLACRADVRHVQLGSLAEGAQTHYYFVRNQLLFRQKVYGEPPIRILTRRVQLGRALRLRQAVSKRDLSLTLAGTLAIADAVRGRAGRRDLGRTVGTRGVAGHSGRAG